MSKKTKKSKKHGTNVKRVPKKLYEAELERLQIGLVEMQQWVIASGARVLVIFEGRDAAGKGGAIKRVMQYLNPRHARVVALPQPSEREKGQWYFQRYVERLPTTGEIVLMDRSWYNRAGVERVMGYCTDEQYDRFLHQVPVVERMLVEDGILVIKYWFSVSDEVQQERFASRLEDPMRRWKRRPPTSSRSIAGRTTRGRRMRCSPPRTSPKRRGGRSRATTSARRASMRSPTC